MRTMNREVALNGQDLLIVPAHLQEITLCVTKTATETLVQHQEQQPAPVVLIVIN